MANEMNMEEFLGHTTSDGGGGNYLENWKKRSNRLIDTFLHPRAKMIAVWQSPWPKMHTRTDKQTGAETIEVWGGNFNGHEKEDVYKNQYFRDPKIMGPRTMEPMECPMAMMIEAVHTAIREGELDWLAELFRFEGTDPAKAKVYHAGGLYNAYGHRSVTDVQKAQIAAAGISLSESWQENMMPKCNYILTIIDADNPDIGPQVTTEKTGLGDKIKALIKTEQVSARCAEDPKGLQGLPNINPYCIRWSHDKNAKNFNDIYGAMVMRKIPVDDAIQAAFDQDPPDVSYLARKGNVSKLRDSMEAAYIGPDGILDFDALFGPAEKKYAEAHPAEEGATADEAQAVMGKAKADAAARTPDVGRTTTGNTPAAPFEQETPVTEAVSQATPAKRKRRTKKQIAADKREEEIMPKVETMSEGDCIAVLDEEGLNDNLREALQARLDAIQAAAEPVEQPTEAATAPEEMFACDKCGNPMKASADTCGGCGTKYNLETGEIIETPPPKPRPRSAAKQPAAESGDRINF